MSLVPGRARTAAMYHMYPAAGCPPPAATGYTHRPRFASTRTRSRLVVVVVIMHSKHLPQRTYGDVADAMSGTSWSWAGFAPLA